MKLFCGFCCALMLLFWSLHGEGQDLFGKKIPETLKIVEEGDLSGDKPDKIKDESSPFSQAKFVPDISLIVDFGYVYRNLRGETFERTVLPGLVHSQEEEKEHGHEHAGMNQKNGFNLNYAELVLAAPVDPYFDLFAACHLSEEGFELEEGYFSTKSLPGGFQVRGGKFLSAFGRLNEQHAHLWDFADMPLVNRAFFGHHGLNEKGLRLTWTAPLPFYLRLGVETLQGENEASFGSDGFRDVEGNVEVAGTRGSGLAVGFVKTSFDLGDTTMLMGVSGARGKTRVNHGIDETGEEAHAVSGQTGIYGADLTIRYMMDSYHSLSLQGEYLYRRTDGRRYEKNELDEISESSLKRRQSGFYAQTVLRFAREWRAGLRYDQIHINEMRLDGTKNEKLPCNIPRYSAMMDWSPTEFSRIRLQYNYDRSRYLETGGDFQRKENHEVILNINLAIGAHGAHAF